MTIALLTHYVPTAKDDYTQLAALTVPNRDEWCARHGYRHIVQCGTYKMQGAYYAFDRLALLRDLLDKPDAPDIIWVLNVQALITNLTRPLDFLDDEHDCWLTKDCHGINLGSFIVRNTAWTKRWLDFIIAHEPAYRAADWKEQKVVQDWWMHEDWTWMIHLLPQRACNSFLYSPLYPPWPATTPGQWRKGDLCLNLPGTSLQQRLDIVSQALQSGIIVR